MQVVPLWHTVEMAFEEPLDLASGQLGGGCDLIERQRFLDVFLHELRDMDQRFVAGADLCAQRHVLPVAVVANAIHDELLGDELTDPRPQLRLHQVQHQVQRRDSAGAGEAVAIDRKELVAQQDSRELLTQCRQILPVNRRPILVEQAGLGECVSTGAERSERHAAVCKSTQRCQDLWRYPGLYVDAAADENDIDRAYLRQGNRGCELEAIARRCRLAIHAHDRPVVHRLARDQVGHAQGLDRTG